MLAREYPDLNLEEELERTERDEVSIRIRSSACCCCRWKTCKGSPVYHPEGDVLYHSLQVFELARDCRPYDEEFLLAALLHDVGKGIDRGRSRRGGAGSAGRADHRADPVLDRAPHARPRLPRRQARARLRRELEASPDFEDLMLLQECDAGGRVPGAVVGTVDEALDYLRELERSNEEG